MTSSSKFSASCVLTLQTLLFPLHGVCNGWKGTQEATAEDRVSHLLEGPSFWIQQPCGEKDPKVLHGCYWRNCCWCPSQSMMQQFLSPVIAVDSLSLLSSLGISPPGTGLQHTAVKSGEDSKWLCNSRPPMKGQKERENSGRS